jgi:hypothetical protein
MNRVGKNRVFLMLSVRNSSSASRKVPEHLRRNKDNSVSVNQLSSTEYSKFARWDWILRVATIGAISATVYFLNKDKIKRHSVYSKFEEVVDRKYDLNVWTKWIKHYNDGYSIRADSAEIPYKFKK